MINLNIDKQKLFTSTENYTRLVEKFGYPFLLITNSEESKLAAWDFSYTDQGHIVQINFNDESDELLARLMICQ